VEAEMSVEQAVQRIGSPGQFDKVALQRVCEGVKKAPDVPGLERLVAKYAAKRTGGYSSSYATILRSFCSGAGLSVPLNTKVSYEMTQPFAKAIAEFSIDTPPDSSGSLSVIRDRRARKRRFKIDRLQFDCLASRDGCDVPTV
jgi:hypothetical protein